MEQVIQWHRMTILKFFVFYLMCLNLRTKRQSRIFLEFFKKMQTICSIYSASFKQLVLYLTSSILYEIFSLLICVGIVGNRKFLSTSGKKFDLSIHHQRLLNNFISRKTNWEMRRRLVCAPQLVSTCDCGAFLLGAVLIFYLHRKKKLKLQSYSSESSEVLASSKMLVYCKTDFMTRMLLLLTISMEIYCMWHEASLTRMRENHNVVLLKELLMAGDVELNPGPYTPELLSSLMNDFCELRPDYYSLGIQLNVPFYIIEEIRKDTENRLAKVFDYWLHNTPEEKWFEQLRTALQKLNRRDLANVVQQKYMDESVKELESPLSSCVDSTTKDNITTLDANNTFLEGATAMNDTNELSRNAKYHVHLCPGASNVNPEQRCDTNDIIYDFNDICDGLHDFIECTPTAVINLQNLIKSWIPCGTIKYSTTHEKLTEEDVEKTMDFNNLWGIFRRYISFFNFKLLERAINRLKYGDGKTKIIEYKKKFNSYLKKIVIQFPTDVGIKTNENMIIVQVDLDDAFANCRMEYLQKLGRDICEILNIDPEKIMIAGVKKNCVCVTFIVHKNALSQNLSLSSKQITGLRKLRYMTAKIIQFNIGGVQYEINKDSDEPHISHGSVSPLKSTLPVEYSMPEKIEVQSSTCLWQLENAVAQHHDLLPSTEVDEPTPKTSAPGHVSHSTDLLHPLATLTWQHCHKPPWGRRWPTHCAALQDRVAVLTTTIAGGPDVVYISSTDLHSWTDNELPYQHMSLTIYQSKFAAVGGRDPSTGEATNTILTSTTGRQWEPSLPPMPTKRYRTSSVSTTSPEVLVVAGGRGSDRKMLNIVEVLMTGQWITIDPLPAPASDMDSTVHEGNLYFMKHCKTPNTMTTCSCTSLISSCTNSSHTSSTDSPLWSQLQAPRGWSIVSYSTQLVIIDGRGTARGYSSTTQSWVEASIAGDRHEEDYDSATTVLPTGELLYCNHYGGVYRGTITVSPYSPEIEFQHNVLTRLEAVMGVQIVSVLAEHHSTLTYSSGVELQPHVHRGREIALPDANTEPAKYVEEVILQWSAGRSCRSPTWRQLLTVLQDIGLVDLSQQIQEFIKGEFKFTNAYRHFIKTKDVVIMRFLKILFSGPPRLGKTTALRRLIGEIIDLLSAGEANLVHSSTGAVESKRNMIVRTLSITTALVADAEWCAVNSHSDEACMLFQMLQQSLETEHVPSTSTPATDKMDTRVTEKATTTTSTTATAQQQPIKRESGKPKPTLPKLNISTPPNDIPVVVELFKKASAQPKFSEHMQHFFKAYLRIEDTGGQPELMDMLPALAISPGLYLLFFNLEWNLKKEFKVFYQDSSGKATTPEESKITLEEMLLSTLSSISCSCAPANSLKGEDANNSEMHDILESSKSVAYLVGTHKDKVSEEKISELDKDLQSIIKGTDFFEKDLVQFCSKDKLIVAMNNMDGGVEEVDAIKKMLNQAMERHFKPLSIPAVWLLLNLCLRMNKARTASMKSVLELSGQFNMSAYETKVSLWFLHHHAGVMMYFPNIPLLEDFVILDSQVVYDSVTFLILRAMSFDSVGQACSEKFEETGQFELKDLVAATDRVSGGDIIPPKKLIALLKFLHIIAPISDQHTCSSVEEQDDVYLMPCVLRTASKYQLDTIFSDPGRPLDVAPLMIRYKCGFVPLGIFPALIASLIPNKSFRLVQRGLMKNKVQFHHQPLKTLVSFLCYPRFYAIVISKLFVSECEVHKECAAIRQQVVAALEQVGCRMNYGNFVDYQFAFECPSHPGKEHLCVVEEQSEVTKLMECLEYHDCRQPEKMASVHTVWWCESKPESPGPVAVSTKQASTTEYLVKDLKCGKIMRLFRDNFPCSEARRLGAFLDLSYSKLQDLSHNNTGNVEGLMMDVLNYWLETDSEKSWSKLADAVEDCGYGVLAEKIRQKSSP